MTGAANGSSAFGEAIRFPHRPDWTDTGEPSQRFPLEWAEDIQPAQGAWLVKGLLQSSGLACIYGPSRAGKSFLALEWALQIASGGEVMGLRTRRTGVAYVGAEAPNGIRKRIRAWLKHNDLEGEPLPFALIPCAPNLSSPEHDDVGALIRELDAARIEFREMGAELGLIIVDTFARATPGLDENAGSAMGAAVAALERIGQELHSLVIPVHHVGKNAALGLRGHSSFFAALDTAIELTHDEETGLRRLRLLKQKDGEDGREHGFTLKLVDLGEDADGDPISSCVIQYADAPQNRPASRKLPAGAAIVKRAVVALLSEGRGERAPPGAPTPIGVLGVRESDVRDRARALGLVDASNKDPMDASRVAFRRGKVELIARCEIFEFEGFIWLP